MIETIVYRYPAAVAELREWRTAGLLSFDDDSLADDVLAKVLRVVREHLTEETEETER